MSRLKTRTPKITGVKYRTSDVLRKPKLSGTQEKSNSITPGVPKKFNLPRDRSTTIANALSPIKISSGRIKPRDAGVAGGLSGDDLPGPQLHQKFFPGGFETEMDSREICSSNRGVPWIVTGRKWPPSETSTNVDLRAGKIMHNTFLKRRAARGVGFKAEGVVYGVVINLQ